MVNVLGHQLPAKPAFGQPSSSAMTTAVHEDNRSSAAQPSISSNLQPETVYTNPVTGISFTRQELFDYEHGRKTNEKGHVVFFKPSFVDEDPWKALRNKK